MRKLLWIPLALLLLAGCSKEQPQQPTEATQPTTVTEATIKPTEPGLYVPKSEIEEETEGAVRAYTLENGEWFGLSSVGTDVLVTGNNAMVLLTGEQGWSTKADVKNLSADTEMDTYTSGVAYYNAATRTVTVLDVQLQSVAVKVLPEDIVGTPVISMIRNEAYYFNGSEIRAVELTAGALRTRLLRQQSTMDALLPEDYFDGNVLSCQVKDATGAVRTEYFSSETGQTYSQDQAIDKMYTFQDQYYIERTDLQVQQRIFGVRNGERQSFLLEPAENMTLIPALEMGGMVSCTETEKGLDLSFYNLTTGLRTAQVSIPGAKAMKAIHSDGTYIWILAQEGEKQQLLRWDISKSPVEDETMYIGPFYSPENPDVNGLQECVKLADTYESAYKVKLHIGTNAMKVTGDYTVVAEHQPQMVRTTLENLQPVLEQLQPVFAGLAAKGKTVQIGLVRRIESGEDWVRFQHDKTWWFLISAQADMADALYQGMTVPIESHVIGNSRDYEPDRWNLLNPPNFTYLNEVNTNSTEPTEETATEATKETETPTEATKKTETPTEATKKAEKPTEETKKSKAADSKTKDEKVESVSNYLEGDTRAFVNAEAMNSISEDRRSIIYNAMIPDNAEMFKSPTMQAKLHRICIGIREAFDLQKSEKTYLWEQYLTTSLAYVK